MNKIYFHKTASEGKEKKDLYYFAQLYIESSISTHPYFLKRLSLCISLIVLAVIYSVSSFYLFTYSYSPKLVTAHGQISTILVYLWLFFIPTDTCTIRKVIIYFVKTIIAILIIWFELKYYLRLNKFVLTEFLFAFFNIFLLYHFIYMFINLVKAIYNGIKILFRKLTNNSNVEANRYIPKILLTLDSVASVLIALSSAIAALTILFEKGKNIIDLM